MADNKPQEPEGFVLETDEETVHHESRARRSLEPAKMNLNLTSMIDIIFQLQIYFILTMSVAVNEGVITAKLPPIGSGDAKPQEMPPNPINIIVRNVGNYNYDVSIDGLSSSTPNFAALKDQLISMQNDPQRGRTGAYKPDNPVYIKPDGSVRWQHVVNAFNAAVAARYSNVSFESPTGDSE